MPTCSICGKNKPQSHFTRRQIRRRNDRKCKQCNNIKGGNDMKSKKWTPLLMPAQNISTIIKLNNNTFLSFEYVNVNPMIYNTVKNTWTKSNDFHHLNTFKFPSLYITIDDENNVMYIVVSSNTQNQGTKHDPELLKYSFTPKCDKFAFIGSDSLKVPDYDSKFVNLCSTVVNDRYHLIQRKYGSNGTRTQLWHNIYNLKTQNLKKKLINPEKVYEDADILHFPRQKKAILMGSNKMKTCSFDTGKWSKSENIPMDYSVRMVLPSVSFYDKQYILTQDEKKMIVFSTSGNQNIIINMEKEPFQKYKSEIVLGERGFKLRFVLLSNTNRIQNAVIFGYFRDCWGGSSDEEDAPILPLDVIRLIDNMVEKETYIHVFAEKSGIMYHLKIHIEYILHKKSK